MISSKGSVLLALLGLSSIGVFAQQASLKADPKPSVTIVPRISVSETFTDNVRLVGAGSQSDQVTELSPGVRLNIEGARLKTNLDYAMTEVLYAQNSGFRRFQNALNAIGTLEAIDQWAFLDFSGTISQQSISAFGTQSGSVASINSNQTEVSNYRLSPYVRGRVGDLIQYDVRYSRSITQTESAAASGTVTADGSINIRGNSQLKSFGWSADLRQRTIDYSAGRPTESDSASLGLNYAMSPQLTVLASVGREANNYTSLDKEDYATSSLGLNWLPSDMTKFSVLRSQRSFGSAHNISFEHRTARTIWKFTDSRDVSGTPSQSSQASLGAVYDLFYNQFASLQPNPVLRAQLVNAFLQANNINPNAIIYTNVLTSAAILQRRQDLSFALLGVRDTITLIASQGDSSRLDLLSTALDDFSAATSIRQRGMSANWAHRLTPNYSLSTFLSQQFTTGSLNGQESSLKSLSVSLTGKVGKQASATVTARRVLSGSTASVYGETSITGSLNMQF